jgi:hypothetical protein
MQKKARAKKVKINTKVAEVVTDKVEKNQIRHQKTKSKDEFVLINTLPILALAQDVTRIST